MNSYTHTLEQRSGLLSKSTLQYGPSCAHNGHHASRADMYPHPVPLLFYQSTLDPGFYENSYQSAPALLPYLPPFHGRFGVYGCQFEPAFIQKRNERERQRVKCVNQGYAKLRDHLPGSTSEKRLSKVETLRAAIRYIKYLQSVVGGEQRGTDGGNICPNLSMNLRDNSDGGSPRSVSSSPELYCHAIKS